MSIRPRDPARASARPAFGPHDEPWPPTWLYHETPAATVPPALLTAARGAWRRAARRLGLGRVRLHWLRPLPPNPARTVVVLRRLARADGARTAPLDVATADRLLDARALQVHPAPIDGCVFRDRPHDLWVVATGQNAAGVSETVAHEYRHLWQMRRAEGGADAPALEADADAWAARP